MSTSALSAVLQDALEKGDVVELESAIVEAEDAMHVSSQSRKSAGSSALASLVARAKDMYLMHMEACRPYVKPLRKACKELNERAIFEALVRARSAPDEVQLCMYTDLCNAETLRNELVATQKAALQVLDATHSSDIDHFVGQCSNFMEDRTLVALVQKREDLLRAERRREAGRMTPLRSASRGGGSPYRGRRDPLEDWGRYENADEGISPVKATPRTWTPHRISDSATRSTPAENVAPHSSSAVAAAAAPSAYPAALHVLEKNLDGGLQRAVEAGSSPWMQAMRSLRQQGFDEVARTERDARQRLEEAEIDTRALMYRAEMLERVQCWADTVAFAQENESEEGLFGKGEEEEGKGVGAAPRPSSSAPSPARLPPPPAVPPTHPNATTATTSNSGNNRATNSTPTRVYAQALAAYPLRSQHQQQQQQQSYAPSPPRAAHAGGIGAADGAILGSALRSRLATTPSSAAAVQGTPRLLRDTPNISPIKEVSTTSGVASIWEHDATYHRGETKPGWETGTPRRRDSTGSSATTLTSAVASSLATGPSLEQRRIQARLRAVLQEEDIHRRDIEGTEDFDRSVFLFPVSARIAMLRRSSVSRLRLY